MASIDKENYNDKVVKQFTIMTVIWGVVVVPVAFQTPERISSITHCVLSPDVQRFSQLLTVSCH